MTIYAAESNNTITHLSGPLETDHVAQDWHRSLGSPGTLVVLDLAVGEEPHVGDAIEIDADGVATLVSDEPEPLEYDVFDADPAVSGPCDWDTSGGPDGEDYDDPEALADDVLDWAVDEATNCSDYAIGHELFVLVRLPDGTNLRRSRVLEISDFTDDASDVTEWVAS